MKEPIEMRIIEAVQRLLTGRVNELLGGVQHAIPVIEFREYGSGNIVSPVISLSACEQTEKERIVRLEAFSLTISFNFPETPESELYCYAYSGAISRAFYDESTLGGVVDRAVITGKKYVPPKKPNCGESWELIVNLRLTIEE